MSLSPTAQQIENLACTIERAEAIIIGAGAGASASAGLTYTGERFKRLFPDFIAAYGLRDMYSATFYPFPTPEERWAYMSRHILHNRFEDAPRPTYRLLASIMSGRTHFAITTNVDYQFPKAGFTDNRLFATQGDYGLWQCSVPCHQATYSNEETVRAMVARQTDCHMPSDLLPFCPRCGAPMEMNLRKDATFVQDAHWYESAERYTAFVREHADGRVLFLELGVGSNTPSIIKYPFWRMTAANPQATYACINAGEAKAPAEIAGQALCLNADIHEALELLATRLGCTSPAPTSNTEEEL